MVNYRTRFVWALLLASSGALANGYCEGRINQRDRDQCYRFVMERNSKDLASIYQKLMSSARLAPSQKQALEQEQRTWERALNAQCKTHLCYDNSMRDRIGNLSVALTRTAAAKDLSGGQAAPRESPSQPQAAQVQGQRVGKTTIFITGKTADGKYNVYNVEGEVDDVKFTAGGKRYTANDMLTYLDAVPFKEDGKNGVNCEAICKNAKGQVIGVLDTYKKLAAGGK